MLLSRVADCLYWVGRYIERTESTARLVKVHTELYLDLPKAAGLSWSPLLAVTGSGETFERTHAAPTEEAIVGFLAADLDNPGSIVSSLSSARENLRITRSMMPRASWEVLNELYMTAVATRSHAVDRRTRARWTEDIIQRCQMFCGALDGTMSHDDAYSFLEIGRFVERADMTTRVLDVQAGVLCGANELGPYSDVTWTSALRSLNAHQMYQRTARAGVVGADALRFLLKDPQFPRSIERCLTEISRALLELPRYDAPMAGCADMQELLETARVDELASDGLHDYVDRLQLCLGRLHELLTETYFPHAQPAGSAELLATA